jgi:aquaporin Z
MLIGHPTVAYAVTKPGMWGIWPAFAAECCITFVLMSVVLRVSNTANIARFTGLCAGALVALYITFESPVSGMSMNPARTLASALSAHDWTALWIYFTAPVLGMLAAAEVYLRSRSPVFCAKLVHDSAHPCIFCAYRDRSAALSGSLPEIASPSRAG